LRDSFCRCYCTVKIWDSRCPEELYVPEEHQRTSTFCKSFRMCLVFQYLLAYDSSLFNENNKELTKRNFQCELIFNFRSNKSQANSASLGAAYRALHGYRCFQANKYFFFSLADMSLHRFIHLSTEMFRFIPFDQVVAAAPPFHKATEPNLDAHKIYKTMLDRYRLLEQKVVQSNSTNCQTTN